MYKKLLLIFLIFFNITYAYSYDLSSENGVKECQNDKNCYVCNNTAATNIKDNLLQCYSNYGYDNNTNLIDFSKEKYFCPSSKQKCTVDINDKLLNKTLKITVKYTKKNNFNIYPITVEYKDKSIIIEHTLITGDINKEVINILNEYNKTIKPYIESDWQVKKSYIKFYYYKPDTSNGSGGESSSFCPEGEYISNTVCNNNQSVNINIYENINIGGDCSNARASLEEFQIFFEMEKEKTNIVCPININNPCYKEGNEYYCTDSCILGSDLNITIPPPVNNNDFTNIGSNSNSDKKDICTIDGITISDGTYMSCRLGSKYNPFADNCCFTDMNDVKNQEKLITGMSDVLSVAISFGPLLWTTTLSDIFKEVGLLEVDIVQEWFKSAIEWIKGGTCSNSELLAGMYSATTRNITYNYNEAKEKKGKISSGFDGGNCVYFGEYCSEYTGPCVDFYLFGDYYNWSIKECKRPSRAFCCYSNIFDKALAKAARDQMPSKYNWGNINGDKLSAYKARNKGQNPCDPDYKDIHVNCNGVSISDLANISLDTISFQNDMKAYTDIMLNEITKNGGTLDNISNNTNNVINDFKNQNPNDIISNALDGNNIDINKYK